MNTITQDEFRAVADRIYSFCAIFSLNPRYELQTAKLLRDNPEIFSELEKLGAKVNDLRNYPNGERFKISLRVASDTLIAECHECFGSNGLYCALLNWSRAELKQILLMDGY